MSDSGDAIKQDPAAAGPTAGHGWSDGNENVAPLANERRRNMAYAARLKV